MLIRHGVRLSPRLADIFDLIEHSGDRGVDPDVMLDVFYPGKARRAAQLCLATNINHLNGFLVSTDFQIKGGRGQPYRVVRGCNDQ
jgi:hypothetical protein